MTLQKWARILVVSLRFTLMFHLWRSTFIYFHCSSCNICYYGQKVRNFVRCRKTTENPDCPSTLLTPKATMPVAGQNGRNWVYRAPAAFAPFNAIKPQKDVASLHNPANIQALLLIKLPSPPTSLGRITTSTTDEYSGEVILPLRYRLRTTSTHSPRKQ